MYAIFNATFMPFIYFFIVETAGKPLEQIDRWFAANPGWLVHNASKQSTYREDDTEERGSRAPLKHTQSDESERIVKDFRGWRGGMMVVWSGRGRGARVGVCSRLRGMMGRRMRMRMMKRIGMRIEAFRT